MKITRTFLAVHYHRIVALFVAILQFYYVTKNEFESSDQSTGIIHTLDSCDPNIVLF